MSAGAWIVDALIASTLLMAAVLLARGPVRRAFGPQVAYALWALPALRLLLPPLPAGWWHAAAAAPITRAGETVVYFVEPLAGTPSVAGVPSAFPSVGLMLGLAWVVGVVLCLGWHAVRHRRFCRAVLADARPLEKRDGVLIVASAAAPGPLAFGIRRRVVVFPADFAERYDADERALALQHELGHHARRDLLANWAALAVLALHWFSPLAWVAFRAFRADQELANDAGVLARCAPDARHAYGRAIVKAASPGFAPGLSGATACHLHTIADLKGRLRMLTISRTSRRRLATGSAAVTLLVAGGLGLTASGSAAQQVSTTLAAPLPVAAPAALVSGKTTTPPPPAAPVTRQRKHVIVVGNNGTTRTYEGADADRYIAEHHMPVPPTPPGRVAASPSTPPVSSTRRMSYVINTGGGDQQVDVRDVPELVEARCGTGRSNPAAMTYTDNAGGKRKIVVCIDRVAAAQAGAEQSARASIGSARASLSLARTAIERDRNLTREQRTEALAGIAEAEAELRDPANN